MKSICNRVGSSDAIDEKGLHKIVIKPEDNLPQNMNFTRMNFTQMIQKDFFQSFCTSKSHWWIPVPTENQWRLHNVYPSLTSSVTATWCKKTAVSSNIPYHLTCLSPIRFRITKIDFGDVSIDFPIAIDFHFLNFMSFIKVTITQSMVIELISCIYWIKHCILHAENNASRK